MQGRCLKSLCKQNDILQKNLETAKLGGERSGVATFCMDKTKKIAVTAKNIINGKIKLLKEKLINRIYKLEADYSDVKMSLDESEVEREKLPECLLELESIVVTAKAQRQRCKDNVRQSCKDSWVVMLV